MLEMFETLYRQLGRATAAALLAAVGFMAFALLSALAGFSQTVNGFCDVAGVLGLVFLGLLGLFLLASLVATSNMGYRTRARVAVVDNIPA